MLQNIPQMLEITRAVVDAVKIPVTVKTRLGWDANNKIIVELAEQLQDCGIAALTIHGRTRAQMYTGEADWTLIGEVKNNPRMHIPIIGNGDVLTAEDAHRMARETGQKVEEVVASIRRVSDIVAQISAASAEQSTGVAQVGQAVTQMDQATQQNAALVEEMSAAAQSLRQQADALVGTVAVFQLERRQAAIGRG